MLSALILSPAASARLCLAEQPVHQPGRSIPGPSRTKPLSTGLLAPTAMRQYAQWRTAQPFVIQLRATVLFHRVPSPRRRQWLFEQSPVIPGVTRRHSTPPITIPDFRPVRRASGQRFYNCVPSEAATRAPPVALVCVFAAAVFRSCLAAAGDRASLVFPAYHNCIERRASRQFFPSGCGNCVSRSAELPVCYRDGFAVACLSCAR